VKSNIASLVVQELTTLASVQASQVVVDHTSKVAASHLSQVSHFNHLSHLGIVKSNIASDVVQLLATVASVQASQVVVVPASIVAASH